MGSLAAESSAPPRRLEGKVALVTGASTGVGECIAKAFVEHGAFVVNADIVPPSSKSTTDNKNISYVYCDVSNESHVENAIKEVISKYGKLDIMVNNAAIADPPRKSILDNDVAEFQNVLNVNLTGVFIGIKHAASAMIPVQRGAIINLGSISSSLGGQISHAYTSSKHAVVGLTRNAAAELGKHGIRVNCLSPYIIATPLTKKFFNIDENKNGEAGQDFYSNLTGKSLEFEDIAYAAIYLASDESKYVSGHNLAVDGGYTVINPAFGLFSRSH